MESTYVTVTVDELIIECIKENPCIYNKSDANYKNSIIKKRVWQNLSKNLKTLYNVDMTADVIEKHWSSLRDMFNREHRKQKMQPSGSGYTPTKEWELYKYMLFLIPHVAHRRTKTSFPLSSQSTSDSTSSALFEAALDTYSEETNLEGEESSLQTEKDELEINSIEEDMMSRSTSTFSNYSSSSSNTQLSVHNTKSKNIKSPSLIFKPVRKVTPELDKFAKRKKNTPPLSVRFRASRPGFSLQVVSKLTRGTRVWRPY